MNFKNHTPFLCQEDLIDIANAILNAPCVGVMVYQEKIVYANDYSLSLTGYTREELTNLSILDLIHEEEDKEHLAEVVKKRLKGERFIRVYQELKIKTKEGKKKVLLTFANTIIYQGRPSGFVVFIDITKHKRTERLLAILREVNQLITGSLFEEEIFERMCKNLVEKMGLKLVWIGFSDKEMRTVQPRYWYGFDEDYLKELFISLDPSVPEGRGPISTAFREKKIFVVSDIRIDPRFIPWRERALEKGYLSVAGIPILKEGKPYCMLTLYSDEPYFFDETVLKILDELKLDIEFAIKRISEIRENVIVAESLKRSPLWILLLDEEGKIVYVNEKVTEVTGFSQAEIFGKTLEVFNFNCPFHDFYEELVKALKEERGLISFVVYKNKNGHFIHLELSLYPLFYLGLKRFLVIGKDITYEVELKDKLEKILSYDVLTETYNLKGMENLFDDLSRTKKGLIFVMVDICDFTYLNKVYGLGFCNKILIELAKVLKDIEEGVQVGRVGGDDFLIILERKTEDWTYLYKKLEKIKELTLEIEGNRVNLFLNIGIVLFPEDGGEFKVLFEKCSAALKESKKIGRSCIKFFDQKTELEVYENIILERLIRRALDNKLFKFYFQPYFRTEDLSLAGVEALVRLEEYGVIINPKVFISYLEKFPYLRKFEKWVIKEIKQKLRSWSVPISINISINSFFDEEFMTDFIREIGKHSNRLRLEITERIFLEDFNLVRDRFDRLKENGIGISIDDFGKGYSSLNYILNIPVDIIKIDMSFVQKTEVSKKHRAVVEIIVELCNRLGIETIAEGVETEEQLDIIRKAGCTYVQGFLLEKPLSEKELLDKYPFIVAGVAE